MADRQQGKITISALACEKCGAPMYPDMQKGAMSCAYCGYMLPFAKTEADFHPRITFRHQPLEVVEGYLKLRHVAIMDKDAFEPPPGEERRMRRTRLAEKIFDYDETAYRAMNDETFFEMNCPHCSKKLSVRPTNNIFSCPYCGQKYGDYDQLSTGDFDVNLIVGRAQNFDGKCLPFRLDSQKALQAVAAVQRQYPDDFFDDDILERAQRELVAAYVPVELADLRYKMQVRSERGTFWFYQECLNWTWTRTLMFDADLLDEVAPWAFNELSTVKPAYLEGNVRLFASQNIGEWQRKLPNYLLLRKTPGRLKAAFGLKRCDLLQCSRDLRRHRFAFVLLPIYYLDCAKKAGENGRQIRVMVNGQTGKAVALILNDGDNDILRVAEPVTPHIFTPGGERTLMSPPVPVRYVKPPFLHQCLPLRKALK